MSVIRNINVASPLEKATKDGFVYVEVRDTFVLHGNSLRHALSLGDLVIVFVQCTIMIGRKSRVPARVGVYPPDLSDLR